MLSHQLTRRMPDLPVRSLSALALALMSVACTVAKPAVDPTPPSLQWSVMYLDAPNLTHVVKDGGTDHLDLRRYGVLLAASDSESGIVTEEVTRYASESCSQQEVASDTAKAVREDPDPTNPEARIDAVVPFADSLAWTKPCNTGFVLMSAAFRGMATNAMGDTTRTTMTLYFP
jgi:hypothetical protein